jgi:hypothetical protein
MQWREAAANSPLGWAVRQDRLGALTFAHLKGYVVLGRGSQQSPTLLPVKNQGVKKFTDWASVTESNTYAPLLAKFEVPHPKMAQWQAIAATGVHKWAFRKAGRWGTQYINFDGTRALESNKGEIQKTRKDKGDALKYTNWQPVQDHDKAVALDLVTGRFGLAGGSWRRAAQASPYGWAVRDRPEGGRVFVHPDRYVLTTTKRSKNPRRVKWASWNPDQWVDWTPLTEPFGDLFTQAGQDAAGKPLKGSGSWVEATRNGVGGWATRMFHKRKLFVNIPGIILQRYPDGTWTRAAYDPASWNDWTPVNFEVDQVAELERKLKETSGDKAIQPEPEVIVSKPAGLREMMGRYQTLLGELGTNVEALQAATLDNPNIEDLLAEIIGTRRRHAGPHLMQRGMGTEALLSTGGWRGIS